MDKEKPYGGDECPGVARSVVYRKGTVKGSYERPGAVSRKKSESV